MNNQELYLRLRPGATIVPISADELQIVFANYTVTFHSPPVTQGILALLNILKDGGTRTQVTQEVARTSAVDEPFIDYLFEQLFQTQCLYSFSNVERNGNEAIASEHQQLAGYHASVGNNPSQVLALLASTQLLAVTHEVHRESLARVFVRAGLDTNVLGFSSSMTCAAAVEEMAANITPQVKMLVCWGYPYRMALTRMLNDLAIERQLPILFGGCQGLLGWIGPYVIPQNTACLECMNRRMLANEGSAEVRAYSYFKVQPDHLLPEPWPVHPLFEDAILQLFGIELSQILLKLPPQTIGGFVEYRYGESAAQRRTIYKVPGCPACTSGTPQRLDWDINFPRRSEREIISSA